MVQVNPSDTDDLCLYPQKKRSFLMFSGSIENSGIKEVNKL